MAGMVRSSRRHTPICGPLSTSRRDRQATSSKYLWTASPASPCGIRIIVPRSMAHCCFPIRSSHVLTRFFVSFVPSLCCDLYCTITYCPLSPALSPVVGPADPEVIHLFFKFYPNLPTLAASAELELETIVLPLPHYSQRNHSNDGGLLE